MYVCICNAFTDKQVKELLDKTGARRPAQVYRGFHCKPQCGKCSPDIMKMINEHHAPRCPTSPTAQPAAGPRDAADTAPKPKTP